MLPLEDPFVREKLEQVQFVAFDFDGVFTDNRVFVLETGLEGVICNRSDGQGLSRLRSLGIGMGIFSTETNPVVQMRAKKLQIPCYPGTSDKLGTLRKVLEDSGIDPSKVAFLGNDINDLDCLKHVGLPVVVADAFDEVRDAARIVLTQKGGRGAVRELCDLIFRSRQ